MGVLGLVAMRRRPRIGGRAVRVLQDLGRLDRELVLLNRSCLKALGWRGGLRLDALRSLQDSHRVAMSMLLGRLLLNRISRRRLLISQLRDRRLRGRFLGLSSHSSLNLLQTHDLATRSGRNRLNRRSGRSLLGGLGWPNAPDTSVDVEIGKWFGVSVLFIARAYRLLDGLVGVVRVHIGGAILRNGGGGLDRGSLAMESEMFLLNSTGNLGCLAEKVEILAHTLSYCRATISKSIVIERIAGFLKLISKTIIGILKVESIIAVSIPARQPCKGVVGLGEARRRRVMATGCVETEE
jgi:hypothetical protein